MIIKLPSVKYFNLFAFLTCCGLLGFGAYLQIEAGQEPCPLCILQRIIFVILALLFLIGGTVHIRRCTKIWFHLFIALISLSGAAVAGRQVWLMHLPPDQIPPCGPGLYYLLESLPLSQAFKILIQGTAECTTVTWRFLTLSIAEWSLIFFIFFAFLAFWQSVRK